MNISINEYLDKVDINFVKQKIDGFNGTDFMNIPTYEIQKKLFEIFCIKDTNGKDFFSFPYMGIHLSKGKKLYRVRNEFNAFGKLKYGKLMPSDLWNHPDSPIGRMNMEGEPVLYVCIGSPETAFYETEVKTNDIFTLIAYTIIEDTTLLATYIANRYGDTMNSVQRAKADILNRFLEEQLCRNITKENDYFYKVTNSIKYIFANYNKMECDGCVYVSAKTREMDNVCLKYPNFHKKLKIDALMCGEKTNEGFIAILGATPNGKNELEGGWVNEDFMETHFPSVLFTVKEK